MSAIRCFVAIPVPECVHEPLRHCALQLQWHDRHWAAQKWVREDQWHITLKFLGDVDESHVARLVDDLGSAASDHPQFEIVLRGLEPRPKVRARMIWATFDDTDGGCAALQHSVERAAFDNGVPLDDRPFHPHVTLCRSRQAHRVSGEALNRANEACSATPAIMSVVSYTLFASRLTPRGPVYSELASWDLNEAR